MRYLAALISTLVCLDAIAHAAEQKPATAAYVKRVAAIVNHLLDSELSKHPQRLNNVSIKLRYEVDQYGRVQRVEIISAKPDRLAANTVTQLIKATIFPPFPKDVLQEGVSAVEGELNWTRSPRNTADSPAFVAVTDKPSCRIEIVGIDSHRLKSAQKQMTLSPGRHLVFLRITDQHGTVREGDGLDFTFNAGHRHSISGRWISKDKIDIHIWDVTATSSNHAMQPTASPRTASVFDD
jgi:hypothetical protein